ncbi:signal peptidase I [Sphingomonas immobilis]|uniref:Signal peptidase I n=1 Tax=Sphingomonas immobilis TaxID=3063997 RepID=A0ABT9A2B9_9SPHN|nr:signal peptidase I [Sphingomonas sp. CA1-15]MDO7843987.1 signal peptidase I [Sphingomonas sp. CA1-15]
MSEDLALTPNDHPADDPVTVEAPPAKAKRTDWWGELRGIFWLVLAVLGFHTFIAKPFYIPSESMLPGLEVGDQLVVSKYPYGWSFISPTFHVLPFIHGRLFGRMPERGDVVIVTPPGTETDYIKRVVGLPGETIEVRQGTVFIDGVPLKRGPIHDALIPVDNNTRCDSTTYPGALTTGADGRLLCKLPLVTETMPNGRHYETVELGDSEGDNYGPVKIPKDHVFLMGDNRDRSSDSRFPLSALGLGGPVPWEYLGGRAEIITFSKTGGGTWNPLTWGESFRGGRAGTSLHPARDPQPVPAK